MSQREVDASGAPAPTSVENPETPLERAVAMYRQAMPPAGSGTLAERRDGYEGLLARLPVPSGVEISSFVRGSVEGFWVDATGGTAERAGVMLHGGGYMIGSAQGYRAYAAYVSRATRSRVLVPEYRLAPENTYPAAIEDAVVAIDAAIDMAGSACAFVVGDSAGGGLTLSSLLAIEDLDLRRVACAVLVSPLVDLRAVNASYDERADEDPVGSRRGIRRAASFYLDGRGPDDAPWAFPMERDLNGLPPSLVMVGTAEVLLDDSRNLAAKLKRDGAVHEYREYSGMVHVWPLFASFLPQGRDALGEIASFVDRHVAGRASGVAAGDLEAWLCGQPEAHTATRTDAYR